MIMLVEETVLCRAVEDNECMILSYLMEPKTATKPFPASPLRVNFLLPTFSLHSHSLSLFSFPLSSRHFFFPSLHIALPLSTPLLVHIDEH